MDTALLVFDREPQLWSWTAGPYLGYPRKNETMSLAESFSALARAMPDGAQLLSAEPDRAVTLQPGDVVMRRGRLRRPLVGRSLHAQMRGETMEFRLVVGKHVAPAPPGVAPYRRVDIDSHERPTGCRLSSGWR